MPTVYHGSHRPITAFQPRPVASVHSLGTWFTSRAEYARCYGPITMAVDLPALRLLEIGPEQEAAADFLRLFGANALFARAAGFAREARILTATLPDSRLPGRYEKMIASDDYDTRNRAYGLFEQVKRVRVANEAARRLLSAPAYMVQMRALFESHGHQGLLFRDSRIDLSLFDPAHQRPHDVYVVFNDAPLPARQLAIESPGDLAPALSDPSESIHP